MHYCFLLCIFLEKVKVEIFFADVAITLLDLVDYTAYDKFTKFEHSLVI
jgi:hypothetical protein